jgi:hypothetical protein
VFHQDRAHKRTTLRDWDAQYESHGRTGYSDDRLYRYDQPLRIRFIRSAIRRVTSELPTELGNLREGLAPIGRLLELEIAPTKVTTAAAKLNRVNERSPAEWENALVDARFQIVRKTTYALLGPIAIHKIERLVDIVTGTDRTPTSNSESIDTNPVSKPELKRHL